MFCFLKYCLLIFVVLFCTMPLPKETYVRKGFTVVFVVVLFRYSDDYGCTKKKVIGCKTQMNQIIMNIFCEMIN